MRNLLLSVISIYYYWLVYPFFGRSEKLIADKKFFLTPHNSLSPDNTHSVAFSQCSSSLHLIEDETFNDRDIINNLMDYEDGQEEPDSLRANKNMQGSSFLINWKNIFLKSIPIKKVVKSYTLSSNETLESKKIKRAILRNLEVYLDKKVLKPPLVGRWPVSYNKTRESAAGTYTSLYTITSSPNAKFPQDIIVYNISRTDNYENIPYDAYRTQHNFEKQDCPEVCERGRTDNKFAAGCPSGYESLPFIK
ncbi:UNVERIFIED_CONTAM: hypothetical protein NCL1_15782 [Trichonephila clavipes]